MRILTYKRTHVGDPDVNGRFGINMCMGRIRDYEYDAVIGVGGIGPEPTSERIARKINWVGVGPKRHAVPGKRASEVTFECFLFLEQEGPPLESIAPNLAARLYERGARLLLDGYSEEEQREAEAVIEWSKFQESSKPTEPHKSKTDSSCGWERKPVKVKRKCGC